MALTAGPWGTASPGRPGALPCRWPSLSTSGCWAAGPGQHMPACPQVRPGSGLRAPPASRPSAPPPAVAAGGSLSPCHGPLLFPSLSPSHPSIPSLWPLPILPTVPASVHPPPLRRRLSVSPLSHSSVCLSSYLSILSSTHPRTPPPPSHPPSVTPIPSQGPPAPQHRRGEPSVPGSSTEAAAITEGPRPRSGGSGGPRLADGQVDTGRLGLRRCPGPPGPRLWAGDAPMEATAGGGPGG